MPKVKISDLQEHPFLFHGGTFCTDAVWLDAKGANLSFNVAQALAGVQGISMRYWAASDPADCDSDVHAYVLGGFVVH